MLRSPARWCRARQAADDAAAPVGRLKILARYNDDMQFYDGHVYLLFTPYQDGVTFTVNDLYGAYDIAGQYYTDIAQDISCGSNHTGSDADKYFTFSDSLKTVTLDRGEIVTIGMYRGFDLSIAQAVLGSIQNSTLWSQLSSEAKTAVVEALFRLFNLDTTSTSDAVDDIQAVLSEYGSDINYLLDGVVEGGVCFNRELYNQKLEWDQYENVTYEMDITQAQLDKMALYLTGNYNKFSILKNSCATVAVRAWNAIASEDDRLVMDGSGIYQYIDAPKSVRDAIRNTFGEREDYHWNSSEGGELADPDSGYTDETGWVYVSAPKPVEPVVYTYADDSLQIDADKSKMTSLVNIAKQGQDITYNKDHQEIAVSLDTDKQGDTTTVKSISFDINGKVVSLDKDSELAEGVWLKAKVAGAAGASYYVTDADDNALPSEHSDGWISFHADALPVSFTIRDGAEGMRNRLTTTIVNGDKAQATTTVYCLVDGKKQELGAKADVASSTKVYISSKMSPEDFDYILSDITFDGTSVMDKAHYDAEQGAYFVVMPASHAKLIITYTDAFAYRKVSNDLQVAVGDTLDIADYAGLLIDSGEVESDLISWQIVNDDDGVLAFADDDHRVMKVQKAGKATLWAGANGNDNIGAVYEVWAYDTLSDMAKITYSELDAMLILNGSEYIPNSDFLVEKGSRITIEPTPEDGKVVSSITSNGKDVAPGEDIIVSEDTKIELSFKKATIKGMPDRVELGAKGDSFQLEAKVQYSGIINQFLSVYDPSITYESSNSLVSVDENGLITVVGEVPEDGKAVTVTAYAGSSNRTVYAKTRVVVGNYAGDRIVGRLTMHARHIDQRELVAHCCITFTTYEDVSLSASYCHYYEPGQAYKSLMEDYRDNPENYSSDPALYNDNELGLEDRESYFIEHYNGPGSKPERIDLRCGESITVSNYAHGPSNVDIILGTLTNGDLSNSEAMQELARQIALYDEGSDEFDGSKTFDSLLSALRDVIVYSQLLGENLANGSTAGGLDINREMYNQFRSSASQMPNSFYTVELTADELADFEEYLSNPSNNHYSLFAMNCGTSVAQIWNTTLADRSELLVDPSYTGVADDPESLYFEIRRVWRETGKDYDPSDKHSEGGGNDFYPRTVACPGSSGATKWKRLSGKARYDTMAAIVAEGFRKSDTAVLACGSNFPDALVSSSVAGALNCPVILTESATLSPQAQKQLDRLGVKQVYIMGGASAVSEDVVATLEGMGISSERISGKSRQATSLAALQAVADMGEFSGTVVVATGASFADALSIGPWCYKTATPILLANDKGELTDDQVALAKSLGVSDVVIVGGSAVVSDNVATQLGVAATRLKGASRYETSKAIAEWEFEQDMTMSWVTVATGQNFPDALAGAPFCGKNNSVILLAQDKNSAGLALINSEVGVKTGYVLGGKGAVSDELFSYLEGLTA